MTLVSPYFLFAPISWWITAAQHSTVQFDEAERFRKATFRNRCFVAGANGQIRLSVPLVHGRDQRTIMREIQIDNSAPWQREHWRTLISAYNRSPYFQHYADTLEPLFHTTYSALVAYCAASHAWAKTQLGLGYSEVHTMLPTGDQTAGISYWHEIEKSSFGTGKRIPTYAQPFSSRHGFFPDLSILDLLFCEGPYAREVIGIREEE